jgi:hypothetical protein
MRKKNKKELKLLTKVARNFKEENWEIERERERFTEQYKRHEHSSQPQQSHLTPTKSPTTTTKTHAEDFV